MQPIQTAFFSGTFNPRPHGGTLILASYLCEYEGFDEVWISVTPQNPLREKLSPEADRQRIEMLRLAVTGNPKIVVTDVEFSLPPPPPTQFARSTTSEAATPDREFTPRHRGRQLAAVRPVVRKPSHRRRIPRVHLSPAGLRDRRDKAPLPPCDIAGHPSSKFHRHRCERVSPPART